MSRSINGLQSKTSNSNVSQLAGNLSLGFFVLSTKAGIQTVFPNLFSQIGEGCNLLF